MYRSSIGIVLPLLAGLTIAGTIQGRAADSRSFVIPARDGYGISECLSKTGECGRVVADSWCEAHGMSKAASYGLAEDITAAIPRAAIPHDAGLPAANAVQPEKAEPGSYVINCEP